MLWQYSRRDSKVLLVATLCTFSGYGFLLGQDWQDALAPQTGFQGAQVVSVGAGVAENSVNSYMAELRAREEALTAREAGLAQAQQELEQQGPSTSLIFFTLGGIVLLALILLNFYLDTKRRHSFA